MSLRTHRTRMGWRRRPFYSFGILCAAFLLSMVWTAATEGTQAMPLFRSRALLGESDDSDPDHASHEDPECEVSDGVLNFEKHGGVVVWLLVIFYCFLGLSLVVDEYFLPALEVICERLKIPENVAGATFMALGGSAPEFFINLAATCHPGNDLGAGSVIGAAFFNMLVIVGAAACASAEPIGLQPAPIVRDAFFYLIAVSFLTFALGDGKVVLWESGVLVLIYFCYLGYLYYTVKRDEKEKAAAGGAAVEDTETESLLGGAGDGGASKTAEAGAVDEDEDADESSGALGKIVHVLSLPYALVFHFTIPDVKTARWHDFWAVTFVLCVAYIGGLSFVILHMTQRIVCNLHTSNALMGLTLVAIGGGAPDFISSWTAAKKGMGDMAVSNSMGSNIFNALAGLGFPWLLSNAVSVTVHVSSDGVYHACILLLLAIALYFATFVINGFELSRMAGVVFFVMYLGFISFSIISHLDHEL